MAKKEYELTRAILRYACDCGREGDWRALRDMGFSPQEIEALGGLNLVDLGRMEQCLDGHVLQVRLDRQAFWVAMTTIRRDAAAREARDELLKRNAPADMMETLFGVGAKEYAQLRRAFGVPQGVGRPSEPDEEVARRVWLAWERVRQQATHLTATDWLALADETKVCVRTIWRLVQRWKSTTPTKDRPLPIGKDSHEEESPPSKTDGPRVYERSA